MLEILNEIDAFVWGPPLLVLLVGTGILLTFRLKLLQVFKLPQALGLIFSAKNDGSGDVNSFKALCTALAATVGTGNIVGVATAIKAGGPRCFVLDVDGGLLRYGNQIFRMSAGCKISYCRC